MDTDTPMDVDIDILNIEHQTQQSQHSHDISWVPPPSESECLAGLYDLYIDGEGLWVVYIWKDSGDARIEPFYNRWPPSKTSARACAWISVNRGISPHMRSISVEERREKFQKDVEGLKSEFSVIVERGDVNVTPEVIDGLAVKYGVLSGKWMVYGSPEVIDQLWRKVTRVVAFDRGYGQLKVSTRKIQNDPDAIEEDTDGIRIWDGGIPAADEGHVICVYVEDYLNKQEVDDLRKALRFRAGVHWAIGFKPDVYTHLGIYKGNKWSLRPSRYHDYDNGKGRSSFSRS